MIEIEEEMKTELSVEVQSLLSASLPTVKVPGPRDKVYKDECMFSFDSPETETGLYVCLNSFWGLGREYVENYAKKTGRSIFLHCRRIKKKVPKERLEGPEKKITRLAIGVEGGFGGSLDFDIEIEEFYQIVLLPGFQTVPIDAQLLPTLIYNSVEGIKGAESALKLIEIEALSGTWDGEVLKVSKFADNLEQLGNGKKIGESGWVCEGENCGLTENLWLNLTDGSILCGRRYADGSGGNNHAAEHYAICRYPLAVKLGTITGDGKGDVYSYAEDDMVEDPHLVKHLAHFGINVSQLQKTDKSMVEMEIELNQRQSEWSTLQESGSKLKPLFGPGYTGLINTGNSCYLNSILQILFSIPHFQDRFGDPKVFETSVNPLNELDVQMTKLNFGLNSGKYSLKKEIEGESEGEQMGISPTTFKNLVGKGHAEFSTKKQQDAEEFLTHLNTLFERSFRESNPADIFKFQVEDKIICDLSGMVKYTYRTESICPLQIPLHKATNFTQVSAAFDAQKTDPSLESIRPILSIESCLEALLTPTKLEFFSTGANVNCTGTKLTHLSTFPDVLVLQLEKYMIGPDGSGKKLDVSVLMPLALDISHLKGTGLQPGEILLPESNETTNNSTPIAIDQNVLQQLIDMGFGANAAERAVRESGNSGSEAAMEWLMQRLDDPAINDPITSSADTGVFVANEESVGSIMLMGFSAEDAKRALKATSNNVERAVDWIFSHQDELGKPEESSPHNSSSQQPTVHNITDGNGKYELFGFVSHMGPSTASGHYICHILKNGSWAIFNDEKVAESENLPKDLGYLYFYRRA